MSAPSSARSRATVWVLSIIAVPVLYLMSVPPIWVVGLRTWGNHPPALLEGYIAPYEWLRSSTPLKAPLNAYLRWCLKLPWPGARFRQGK
ncbi:MAG: hypothetical protein ACAH88_03370 [Roseimicrobium sp.]